MLPIPEPYLEAIGGKEAAGRLTRESVQQNSFWDLQMRRGRRGEWIVLNRTNVKRGGALVVKHQGLPALLWLGWSGTWGPAQKANPYFRADENGTLILIKQGSVAASKEIFVARILLLLLFFFE